jgi:TonB family protein
LRDKVQNGLERLNALPRDVSISGRVVDEQGKGLAGVSVLIVGSQEGTATGVDGSFSLHNVPENALLQLSIIGYARQTISVEGRTKFSIAMSRKPANIEKVIVVGYADQSAAKDSLKALPDRSRVFMSVEKMPQFPGGHTALMKYLHDHIRYPQEARKQHVQGTVVVSFVVNADGSIRDISTHNRTLGSGLEEEAIRIVKGMPHWQPGQQNGRPVAVEYNMPIQFVLE